VKPEKSPSRGVGILVVAFLVLAVVIGALVLRKYETARTPPTAPQGPTPSGVVRVTLFFASPQGDTLVREGRELESCSDISACLESIMEELISGPVGGLTPVLPENGMFHSVVLDGGTARVDLAPELIDALPGGSSSELLAVYAVVNSLVTNYPQVGNVVFTLDGRPLETLKGHIDLRGPVTPDFSLERPAATLHEQKGTKP
jgi:hypothetical protein